MSGSLPQHARRIIEAPLLTPGGRAVVITANAGGAAWTPDEGTTWFVLPGVTGGWAGAFAS